MILIRRFVSLLAFVFGLASAPTAFSATSTICELALTSADYQELFDNRALGLEIVDYMRVLDHAVAKIEADSSQHGSAFTNPSFLKKFELVTYYRTAVFPILKGFASNAQLLSERDLDRALRGLAEEEKDFLLKQMDAHNSHLIPALLSMSGLQGDSVIVEFTKEQNQRVQTFWVQRTFEMYHAFARKMGWKFEVMQVSEDGEGIKNAMFRMQGSNVYQYMMFESGSHRFIHKGDAAVTHTNRLKVTVYPEPSPMTFNFDVAREVEFKTAKASGAGGQHVNKTESAVRAIHTPSGLEVNIESERSQHDNRRIAIELLRAKVYDLYLQEQEKVRNTSRDEAASFVADERYVRTYDERYNSAQLESILDGNLQNYIRVRQREYLAAELPRMTKLIMP